MKRLFPILIALLLVACSPEPTPVPPPTETPLPPTETTPPIGLTRDDPVPVNTPYNIENFTIIVTGSVRPADEIVAEANPFDRGPSESDEDIMVELEVACNREANVLCTWNATDTQIVGASGVIRSPDYLVRGATGQQDNREFFGGTVQNRTLFFEISQTETDLLLIYRPNTFGSPRYFIIPESE